MVQALSIQNIGDQRFCCSFIWAEEVHVAPGS
jgi:hypothetical protein